MPTKPKFDFDRIDRRTARVTPALIAAIRDRIVEHLQPEKIILFGSRAKDTASSDSDVDLLLILSDKHPYALLRRLDRFGAVLKLFHYRSFGLDAMVLTESEIEKIQHENEGEWDLVLEILEEGKTLYDRTQKENQSALASARA
ncbi:nucleotidyltransferase domain-containing protein [candidate division KSB1 bacterium]|nr:nucleotidyltransferase domain-containing protein [candidate division KSB1 bacterium]